MKKVIFFITSLDSGGVENYLLRFLEHKQQSFSHIIVFCKSGKGGQLEEKYRSLRNVCIIKRKIGLVNFFDYLWLMSFLSKKKDFAVCDFTGNFGGLVLSCARLMGLKKRIAFFRESVNQYKPSKVKDLIAHLFTKLTRLASSNILANSEAALQNFYGRSYQDNNKFDIVYNGFCLDSFVSKRDNVDFHLTDYIPGNSFVLGHVGRVTEAKNHLTIINVFKKILDTGVSDAFLILCGNGVPRWVDSLCLPLFYREKILALDYTSSVHKVLESINCFYFPSLNEGQPNSLIEALAMGVPFVASDIDSIKEIIPEDYYTWLVPALDEKSAIQKIISIKCYGMDGISQLRDYIIDKFDSETQFSKFENYL